MTRVVCISDTHEQNLATKWDLPEGDILIHAGDLTARGKVESVRRQADSISRLIEEKGYRIALFVPGNHDRLFAINEKLARGVMASRGIVTLIDELIEFKGLRIYGCPWIQLQPEDIHKLNPDALNFSRLDVKEYVDRIPYLLDILITHQPPSGMMDCNAKREHIGGSTLASRLQYSVVPRYHIFGHNHSGHGVIEGKTTFINASLVDDNYKPAYEPIVIEV